MNIECVLEDDRRVIDEVLVNYFQDKTLNDGGLTDSMRYSLLAGGKRVRPVLCLEFTRACGGNIYDAKKAAAGLEMMHTASLIHDDLPGLDNDGLRRKKPTNHVVYGEATAILAGDALMLEAVNAVLTADLTDSVRVGCAQELISAGGIRGICTGQVLDSNNSKKDLTIDELKSINEKKTAALLRASCVMGVLIAGGSMEQYIAAEEYANRIGLAFQVRDDILDITSTDKELGKPVGSDKKNNKATFAEILGVEKCQNIVLENTRLAKKAIEKVFVNTEFLTEFADWLAIRTK